MLYGYCYAFEPDLSYRKKQLAFEYPITISKYLDSYAAQAIIYLPKLTPIFAEENKVLR